MKKDKRASPSKHIPQRTCIACRTIRAKRELVRVVCLAAGGVQIDLTGKKSGRGAYLCTLRSCWEGALNTGRLENALKTKLAAENKEKLVIYARGLDNRAS